MTKTADGPEQIDAPLTLETGAGGLACVRLRTPWSTALVYRQGAHLAEFTWHDGTPLLFTSAHSRYAPGQPIRGGVPVIFPWFGDRTGAPSHGIARTTEWLIEATGPRPDGRVAITFGLTTAATPCAVRYTIDVGDDLRLRLDLVNTHRTEVATVEHCLHTYFAVGDVEQIALGGLHGARYLDKVDGFAVKTDEAPVLRFAGETDRVYVGASGRVTIDDPMMARRLVVDKTGARSTVVWNPWSEKARALRDLGDDEYRRMVCVESGSVGPDALTLPPGARHTSTVTIARAPLPAS